MDVGDYLTNVVSTHELSSIRYAYLEATSALPFTILATRRLAARWQKAGHLVTHDESGRGLWLFESAAHGEALSAIWSSIPPTGQLMRAEDVDLSVKHTTTYDFSSLYEFWRTRKATLESRNTTMVKDTSQKILTTGQNAAQNSQAMAANSTITLLGQAHNKMSGEKSNQSPFPSVQDAHEHFLMALMSSISTVLCEQKGYVPLGRRTLVAPEQSPGCCGTGMAGAQSSLSRTALLTLDADYTGSKILVIKATLSETRDLALFPAGTSSAAVQEISKGSVIVLAPGGIFARYMCPLLPSAACSQGSAAPESSFVVNARRPDLASWMRRTLEWLETKGLNTSRLTAESWLLVEVNLADLDPRASDCNQDGTGPAVIVPWPASLCFRRQAEQSTNNQDQMPLMDAMDMVGFVQTWLLAEEDRAQTYQMRKQEREAAEAAGKAQAQVEIEFQDLSHMTSPLALRRSSLAGMVYPTPPDGVHATPTFDGSTSTPGLLPMSHAMETVDLSTSKPSADDNDHFDAFPNHVGATDPSDSNNNSNNLFDDMGDDDLFGIDNGVTDADFSFFDQPDVMDHMDASTAHGDEISHDDKHTNIVGDGDIGASPASMIGGDAMTNHDITMGNTEHQGGEENTPGVEKETIVEPTGHGGTKPGQPSPTRTESSPPLKPDTVFRRLSCIDLESLAKPGENRTIHESLPCSSPSNGMEPSLVIPTFQQKYGPKGRYIYPTEAILPNSLRRGIPTTDYFKRRRQRKLTARTNGSTFTQALEKPFEDHADENSRALVKTVDSFGTPSSLSEVDESTDDEDTVNRPNSNGKRKREVDDEGNTDSEEDFMSASLSELRVSSGGMPSDDGTLASFDVAKLDGDPAGWSLSNYLAWPDSWTNTPILRDTDFVAAARILTDQAMSLNFEYSNHESSTMQRVELEASAQGIYSPRHIQQDVLDATRQFFEDADACTLTSFLSIRGIKPPAPVRIPPRPIQPSSTNQASGASQNPIFEIPPPHLEVRRSDSKLTVLPSAIDFWDVLGLAPRSHNKDVTAICLYSAGTGTEGEAELFMENMRSAYESKRFGCHDKLEADGVSGGVMALDLDQPARFSSDRGMSFVSERLTDVLKAITTTRLRERNFVLYFVYDPEDSSALVGICGAFELILSRYRLATVNHADTNEIVLQLVPRNLVGSRKHIVVPSPNDLSRLALEVYDRCYNFELGWPSPSMSIEPPLPRSVDFKLTPTPSASLLHENSCLHIAYAQSIDDGWISVAWTDNGGNEQFTASYCLGRKGDVLSRSFQEVAHEIWETTLDIISARKVHWRLMVVKCGPIEPHDTQFWCDLARTESKAHITLMVLTVDTAPSLQFIPPEIELPEAAMATQSAFSSTPVSTPQGTCVLSPDSGVVSTPAAESVASEVKLEPDATLLALSDQTYGAILGHELNDRNCLLDLRPTMLSGYVIKRAEHAPKAMEVNIIWTEMNKNLLDRSLREILTAYGNLATLARARGVVDSIGDPRPWHIIMAERICKAMYVLM